MNTIPDDNPQWLKELVLDDLFQWDKAHRTTFQEFFDYVTYHDSYWIGSFTNGYLEHILVIRLDSFWNKEYCGFNEDNITWPFSIIKIENNHSVKYTSVDTGDPTISNTKSELVDGVAITQFINLGGNSVELTHQPTIAVLLINAEGEYLNPNPKDSIKNFQKEPDAKPVKSKWWKF